MTHHVRTTIRFDGPALVDHSIDVQDLAPSLLALADIVQIANRRFNGDRADVRVFVNADVEQQCFMLDLSLVQSLVDQAKGLFTSEHIKSAKDIAADIGLITGITGVGLFQLFKFLAKSKEAGITLNINQGEGGVTLVSKIGTISITNNTYLLAQDPIIVAKAKAVIRPLERPGYSNVSFIENDKEVFQVEEGELDGFAAITPLDDEHAPTESISKIDGIVRIKSAQYEGNARWGFMWNGRAIDAEMVEDAATWVSNFQANKIYAPPNSVLSVMMTETVRLDDAGNAVGKAFYSVKAVHSVRPPPMQAALL